jgi:hypothetical protein
LFWLGQSFIFFLRPAVAARRGRDGLRLPSKLEVAGVLPL